MIARIKFEGIIRGPKKKSVLPDHIDIHVAPDCLEEAKEIFESFLAKSTLGLKGSSGVFHPLGTGCSIKFTSVEEVEGGS
jgi:hypothetical protein